MAPSTIRSTAPAGCWSWPRNVSTSARHQADRAAGRRRPGRAKSPPPHLIRRAGPRTGGRPRPYAHRDADLALQWVNRLTADMRDTSSPPKVRQLDRALRRWRTHVAARHAAQVSNGSPSGSSGSPSAWPASSHGTSAGCCTPAASTGPSSPPLPHVEPADFRSATNRRQPSGAWRPVHTTVM